MLSANGGNITINGGTLTATGGTGIGGGAAVLARSMGIYNNNTGNITVNAGTIIATGGTGNAGSRGIQADSGFIEITGGTVTAVGGTAVPNSEQNDKAIHSYGIYVGGGNGIEISGGTVSGSGGTATNTYDGSVSNSFGIYTRGCHITISGGVVTACGGAAKTNSYGIYGYARSGVSPNVTISGGTVSATGGAASGSSYGIFADGSITVSAGGAEVSGNTFAANKLPGFVSTWYQWKANTSNANPGSSYTDSVITPFTAYDTSKYFRVMLTGSLDPVITAPTANKTLNVTTGNTATVTVTTQNALSYQWFRSSGSGFSAVSGATGASYTIPATVIADNGAQFYCVVSGAAGTFPATGKVYTLNVAPPRDPSITDPTSNKTVRVTIGRAATITVTAQDAVRYQWYIDEGSGFSALAGATSASYTTPAASIADDGTQYYCVASGATGTSPATSYIFTLNVTEPGNIPVTGDQSESLLWVGIALFAVIGLAGCVVLLHKSGRT